MRALLQDLRYGLRMVVRGARVTAVAVLSLALGLGANTAIFSLVHAVLLRPLPYRDPDRLTFVWESNPQKNLPASAVSPANYLDFKEQNRVFEGMAASEPAKFAMTGAGEPSEVPGLLVCEGFFATLGVTPARGRDFLAAEMEPSRADAVVVSHGFWDRRFGRDPNLVGQTITLNGRSRTVVGIMPPRFEFPDRRVEVWVPQGFTAEEAQQRGYRRLSGIARLKQGVTFEQAAAEMNHIAARLGEQYPVSNRGFAVKLLPLHEQRVKHVRAALLVLLGAVGLVLLIACTNIASLLVARHAARGREMAIRAALGAGRGHLMRQLLLESCWLSLLAGGVGLALTPALARLLLLLGPKDPSLPEGFEISLPVLGFGLAATLLTVALCGLLPALRTSRANPSESLKEGGRHPGAGLRRHRLLNGLVVAEVAVALVLLAGAGVMLRSVLRLRAVNPGFRADNVLTVRLTLSPSKYAEPRHRAAFHQGLLERIRGLPGVEGVAATNHLPMVSDFGRAFNVGGRPVPPPGEWPAARFRSVTPEYFRVMRIPVLAGRAFAEQDRDQAPNVAIINQTLARQYFSGADPIGQQVNLGLPENPRGWRTIVGVVGDVRHDRLDTATLPEVYASYYQMPEAATTLVVRAASEPARLAPAVRAALRAVDGDQPLGEVRTMERVVAESEGLGPRRTVLLLLGAFAALALALAVVGIYGVISYSVVQRTPEIGVRMALGAQTSHVLGAIVRQALALVLAGVGVGALVALALTRLLSKLLYGVSPADPLTFVAVALLVVGASLLASYLPARAATRVDPMSALRVA